MTLLDEALSVFLEAEHEWKKSKGDPEFEKIYGQAKQALFAAIKTSNEIIRFYAMGGQDEGRNARQLVRPN